MCKVDGSMDGIELQDPEFIAVIPEGWETNRPVGPVVNCYHAIGKLATSLGRQEGSSL